MGLASYLLIGFLVPQAQRGGGGQEGSITTRVSAMWSSSSGILFLYSQAGTLLFYDHGKGCLDDTTLNVLMRRTTVGGLAVSTGIGLLIFCGAIGKSGQFPLHVWLPAIRN